MVNEQRISVVDLPGMYSLVTTQSEEAIDKRIACDYILTQQVDVIVNVVDANHLERHLYLTSQLAELGRPIILAINMMDTAKRHGIEINFKALARELQCEVIPIIASQQRGIESLKKAISRVYKNSSLPKTIKFPQPIEEAITSLTQHNITRLAALRLLEKDDAQNTMDSQASIHRNRLREIFSEDPDIVLADARYTAIHGITQKVVQRVANKSEGFSERIDRVVLHRLFGIPIFLFVMYALFFLAINVGGAFQDFFDITTQAVFVDGLAHGLTFLGTPPWLNAVLTHGIGKGINTTLTFIPVLASMYFFLSLLEASGYMARATFLVDRLMRAMGLPGQAFIPLIVGFGCNVPGIMATRHLENHRDRVVNDFNVAFYVMQRTVRHFCRFSQRHFSHPVDITLYFCCI